MIDEGRGFEMTVHASEPDEASLLHECAEDLWDAVEEGRLRFETPRGSVGQTALDGLGIHFNPKTRLQPYDTIALDFDIRLESDELSRVSKDMHNTDLTMAAYGDRHVWELSEIWGSQSNIDITAGGDDAVQSVSLEFMTATEVDWRW